MNTVYFLLSILAVLLFTLVWRRYSGITEVSTETFKDGPQLPYLQPDVEIKHSFQIGSRGVFANREYARGDVIEVCPALKQTHALVDGEMGNYVFTYDDTFSLIGFGYCSMYNHSDQNNAEWEVINDKQIKVIATQPIPKGQEIFVSYGDEYWKGKTKK